MSKKRMAKELLSKRRHKKRLRKLLNNSPLIPVAERLEFTDQMLDRFGIAILLGLEMNLDRVETRSIKSKKAAEQRLFLWIDFFNFFFNLMLNFFYEIR